MIEDLGTSFLSAGTPVSISQVSEKSGNKRMAFPVLPGAKFSAGKCLQFIRGNQQTRVGQEFQQTGIAQVGVVAFQVGM